MEQEIIDILIASRLRKGISQKDIADAVGKSKRTVQNWEAGIGSPTVEETIKWLDAVGYDLTKFTMAVKHGMKAIEPVPGIEDMKSYIHHFIDDFMTDKETEILYFLLSGDTGSVIYAYFNKMAADLACPIHDRVSTGLAIYSNYEVAEALGTINKNAPAVDKTVFEAAIGSGKEAVKKRKKGYDGF